MEPTSVGRALRAIRIEKKMTQEELIELADLSRSQIYYIESGKRIPKLQTIQAICAALGISIYDLVCYIYCRD